MTTAFALLCQVCGLSTREAAAFLGTRHDTVKSWSSGRNPTPAGIIEKEAPIHISNLKLICRACQKPVRVGFRVRSDNIKVRVCRSCGEDVD